MIGTWYDDGDGGDDDDDDDDDDGFCINLEIRPANKYLFVGNIAKLGRFDDCHNFSVEGNQFMNLIYMVSDWEIPNVNHEPAFVHFKMVDKKRKFENNRVFTVTFRYIRILKRRMCTRPALFQQKM